MLRYSAQIESLPSTLRYDALTLLSADLTSLTSAQCRVLLDEIVDPNLKDLRAWAKTLVEMRKPLETELKGLTGRRLTPKEQVRRERLTTTARQIHDGLVRFDGGMRDSTSEEGVWPEFVDLLKPLMRDARAGIPGRPGQASTDLLIAKLERDASYLRAFVRRWPSPEATRPYKLSKDRIKPYYLGDREVGPGDVIQLTEATARAHAGIFVPTDLSPVLQGFAVAAS